jgi:3-oxoacyl-[acyl-carrier-protein] synthase III
VNRYDNVVIAGLARVEAPERITSSELTAPLAEQLKAVGMPRDFLEGITGIRARRFWPRGMRPSAAATLAGQRVLETSGVAAKQIGALVSTSVSKDYVEPAVACFVHHALGLPETCINFDIGNACLAFLNGMDVVAQMIERGQIEHGMIVVGESSRPVVEATVRRLAEPTTDSARLRAQLATLTLGSGAAAMILAHARSAPEGHAYLGTVSLADTAHHDLCLGTADEGLTDTQSLLTHGVALAKRTWGRAVETLRWPLDSVDLFAIHQVSGPHTTELARAVGFDPSRAHPIYPEHGNVGPASVPIVLADADEAELLDAGDRVILGGIGSGLNCTVGAVIW